MERDFRLALTRESMHGLEPECPTLIEDYPYTQLPKQVSYPHAILQVDKKGIVDHQPCSTKDMKSS